MDEWVTKGTLPPDSRVPRLADGTAVPPLPQETAGFPKIPGVTYNGLKTTRYRFNYGPRFDQGIMDLNPPTVVPSYQDNPLNGPIYPSFVSKVDADGNEIAGVRLPELAVPLNTYTGWALRAAGQGENDGCESSGQRIPFATTKAARTASGDPRLSIEERYPNFLDYYYKVVGAINDSVGQRFLLPEDAPAMANRMLNAGFATGAIKMAPDDADE